MNSIRYRGQEAADTRFHDGALRPVIGACNVQVMRANRAHPDQSQGLDFTYNHAPMLCRWHGMMYLMYLTSPVHEHDGLARAMLMRSADGFDWSKPEVVFPDIAVPQGVYCGDRAEELAPNARTVVHHRMGFYRAPNDVLLVMTFHGVSPNIHIAPNSGYGMGRVVRRILGDGTEGEIHVLRVNEKAGWAIEHFPYRFFEESEDQAFVDACHALLKDRLANGAWWEEERLDETFFPLKEMRAPSFYPLPGGKICAVGKMGDSAISEDHGESWSEIKRIEGMITSAGKCFVSQTGDGRYAILYNPSPDGQHRWPLAVITSEDGYTYEHMACVTGEVAPMRYGGYLKCFGINYIRGMMPGNDDAPDGYLWATYSMNKEDIWVLRLPRTIEDSELEPVHDRFDAMQGIVPDRWNVYSPQWARVALEEGCLTLHDSEPWDYAKAVRTFPATKLAQVHMQLQAHGSNNGMLQVDVSDGRGMTAARLILAADGSVRLRGGNGEWPFATFRDGETLDITLSVDCDDLWIQACVNGQYSKKDPLMCPVLNVERLTLRTGDIRILPTPEDNLKNICIPDRPDSGERVQEAIYRVAAVDVV